MSSCGSPFGRFRIGEIFRTGNNVYEFTCDHCLYDFKQFAEFTAHIEEYLEEMISCEQPVQMEDDSEGAPPSIKMVDFIGHNSTPQTMLADEISVHSDNDSQESRDNDINRATESEIGLNTGTENGSDAENAVDDEDVCIVIDDDDSESTDVMISRHENQHDRILPEQKSTRPDFIFIEDDDDDDYEDDDADDEIENEPDYDGTGELSDDGYKCPLCQSCYSSIDFLQMHLSNFHSESTIHKYLAVATRSSSDKVHHLNISNRIEDLPSENILFEDSPEAAEYSKYIFKYRFEKTAAGLMKCPKCDFTGIMFKVKNHVFTHSKKKLFTCSICKQKLSTLSNSRMHMRKVHLCP